MKVKLLGIYLKCPAQKDCTQKLLSKINLTSVWEDYFHLTIDDERVIISFVAREFPNLPSELVFAERVLATIQLSSLIYGIVNFIKHVTYITNEALTSRHYCVFECYTCELDLPKKLAGCRFCTRYFKCILKRTAPVTYYTHTTISSSICTKLVSLRIVHKGEELKIKIAMYQSGTQFFIK